MGDDPVTTTYIFDIEETNAGRVLRTRSRLYRVCDRQRNFRYWEIEFKTTIDDVELASGGLADFEDGAYFDIPDADKARAMTRISRA